MTLAEIDRLLDGDGSRRGKKYLYSLRKAMIDKSVRSVIVGSFTGPIPPEKSMEYHNRVAIRHIKEALDNGKSR